MCLKKKKKKKKKKRKADDGAGAGAGAGSSPKKAKKESEAPQCGVNQNKDPADKLRPDTKSGPEQKGPFGKNYEGGIPANQPLVDALWELRGLEFKGGATYKAIAYGKGAAMIATLPYKVVDSKVLVAKKTKVKFIGKGLAQKIQEFLDDGKIQKSEDYKMGIA